MKEKKELISIQKALQNSGYADRRTIRLAIRNGEIYANGQVVTDPHFLIDPDQSHLKHLEKRIHIQLENRVYFIFNKPAGVLSALSDKSPRPTLANFITTIKERIYPVGRLDFHSEGLILLTNDGDLTNFMISPRNDISKSYMVKIKGRLDEDIKQKILDRGYVVDAVRIRPQNLTFISATQSGNSWWQIDLVEGKKHVVRNLFKYLGHPVSKLKRVAIGPIKLKTLPVGHWRELTHDEVRFLKKEIHFTETTS